MTKKTRNYVPNDGYTLPGFIDAREGILEAVRFTYRPVTADKQCSLNALLESLADTPTNPAGFRKRAEILKGQLVSWDLTDAAGKPLPIAVAEIRKLSPELFWRLFGIVYGRVATDIDPRWADEEQEEEARLAAEAEQTSQDVGVIREAANEKN